jgi:hypothetical protein
MARENRDWGYDRIAGALANLGYKVCDQTVGNVLQRHGLPPAPERKRTTTWSALPLGSRPGTLLVRIVFWAMVDSPAPCSATRADATLPS